MADRYFHLDVRFMHKRTCDRLYDKFGWGGPMAFVALCAQAKVSDIPGTFIYENDAIAWAKLGFEGRRPDFTLDEFLAATGRLKQTSRTRVGRVTHVVLSQYGRWQKDGTRQNERERKRRYRGENERDTRGTKGGTSGGTGTGQKVGRRTRTRSIPPTPHEGRNGNPEPRCPICNVPMMPGRTIDEHLANVHAPTPA